MSALNRSLVARSAVSAVGLAAWALAVWQLGCGVGSPAEAMGTVLAWGLGLLPVHVASRVPRSAGGSRSVRRFGGGGDGRRDPMGRQGKGDQRFRWYGRG
jgi:hypothetical protein